MRVYPRIFVAGEGRGYHSGFIRHPRTRTRYPINRKTLPYPPLVS